MGVWGQKEPGSLAAFCPFSHLLSVVHVSQLWSFIHPCERESFLTGPLRKALGILCGLPRDGWATRKWALRRGLPQDWRPIIRAITYLTYCGHTDVGHDAWPPPGCSTPLRTRLVASPGDCSPTTTHLPAGSSATAGEPSGPGPQANPLKDTSPPSPRELITHETAPGLRGHSRPFWNTHIAQLAWPPGSRAPQPLLC